MKMLIAIVLMMLPACAQTSVAPDVSRGTLMIHGWLDADGTVWLKQTR